jgi:hypothetical protein
MNKFILPVLASMILLVPQPADAWNQKRRNVWSDIGANIVIPFTFAIILVGGMHITWPVKYRGNGGKRRT